MDDEKRKREMIKRLGRMEEIMSAGDRKRIKEEQKQKEAAEEAQRAKEVKSTYDVGSTSYEMTKRLKRMEQIEADGKMQQSKKAKKDLWAKLSEQAKKRYN